jgi:hypothetical protein
MDMPATPSSSGSRLLTHALLGSHSLVTVGSELTAEAPLIAGLIAVCVGLCVLQVGVLAACTRGVQGDETTFGVE